MGRSSSWQAPLPDPASTSAAKGALCYWLTFHSMCLVPPLTSRTVLDRAREAGYAWPLWGFWALMVVLFGSYLFMYGSAPGYVALGTAETRRDAERGEGRGARREGGEGEEGEEDTLDRARGVELEEEDGERAGLTGGGAAAKGRWCKRCRLRQRLRTKHCFECNRCVRRFDHHCFWVGTCVGEGNHCRFWWFLCLETAGAAASVLVTWSAFTPDRELADKSWGAYWNANPLVLPLFCCEFALFWLPLGLLCFHTYLALTNQTTWEHLKWSKIWYLKAFRVEHRSPFDSEGGMLGNAKQFCGRPGLVGVEWTLPVPGWEPGSNVCDNDCYSCC